MVEDPADAQLVQSVVAMHDERVLDAEATQRRGHALGDTGVSNPEHLRARARPDW